MNIYYNNNLITIQSNTTVLDALNSQEVVEHKAVWLNGEHVPLDDFDKIMLKENDRIKVVRIRGGG